MLKMQNACTEWWYDAGNCWPVAFHVDWVGPAFRYRDQRDRPDLTNPDSLALYLESRFEQLRVSSNLCAQEAP